MLLYHAIRQVHTLPVRYGRRCLFLAVCLHALVVGGRHGQSTLDIGPTAMVNGVARVTWASSVWHWPAGVYVAARTQLGSTVRTEDTPEMGCPSSVLTSVTHPKRCPCPVSAWLKRRTVSVRGARHCAHQPPRRPQRSRRRCQGCVASAIRCARERLVASL